MRYIGFGVGRLEHLRCAGFRVGVFLLVDDAVLGRVLFEPRMHVPGRRIDLSPRRCQPKGALGQDRHILALGKDPDKAAVAHDRHKPRHRLDLAVIERDQPREIVRRTNYAAVEHSRQRHVLNEARPAGDLVGQIAPRGRPADHPVVAQRSQGRCLVDLAVEQRVVRAFPEARAPACRPHGAVRYLQIAGRYAEPRRSAVKEQRACLRAGAA